MTSIDESQLVGKCRSQPIGAKLRSVLKYAGRAAHIETILIVSGGQPSSASGGCRTGSTRHDHGRAADLKLIVGGKIMHFTDGNAPSAVKKFITEVAAAGATGIGAGERYMGPQTLHIGFGATHKDTRRLVWGAQGRSINAPNWLREAAQLGWERNGN